MLPELVRVGDREGVGCRNLCNRKNGVWRQFQLADAAVNQLRIPSTARVAC